MIEFTVFGVAQPKGSAKAFLPKGWTRPIVTSDNPKNRGWQQLVAEGASRALAQQPSAALLEGAVRLVVVFYLPRPKKYQTRRYDGQAVAHLTKPDLDKLVRSVKDALTRVVWHDDSQVIELIARKFYATGDDAPHAEIRVEPAFIPKTAREDGAGATIANSPDPQHPLFPSETRF